MAKLLATVELAAGEGMDDLSRGSWLVHPPISGVNGNLATHARERDIVPSGGWRQTCRLPIGSGPEGSSPNEFGMGCSSSLPLNCNALRDLSGGRPAGNETSGDRRDRQRTGKRFRGRY